MNHVGLAIKVCQLHSGGECRRYVSYRAQNYSELQNTNIKQT